MEEVEIICRPIVCSAGLRQWGLISLNWQGVQSRNIFQLQDHSYRACEYACNVYVLGLPTTPGAKV